MNVAITPRTFVYKVNEGCDEGGLKVRLVVANASFCLDLAQVLPPPCEPLQSGGHPGVFSGCKPHITSSLPVNKKKGKVSKNTSTAVPSKVINVNLLSVKKHTQLPT